MSIRWIVKSLNSQELYPPNRKQVVQKFDSEMEVKAFAWDMTQKLDWPSNQYMSYYVKKCCSACSK